MGFFKWLDNHIRESNERWSRDYEEGQSRERARKQAQQDYEDSIECCANCYWFHEYSCGRHYWCTKHDFCFDFDDARSGGIHYKKTCHRFTKK